MSRLGIFACLLMLAAVAICVDMPPNMKPLEPPKDGAKVDPQIPPRPEGAPPRPEGAPPRPEGREAPPKAENPKPDGKPPQDAKS